MCIRLNVFSFLLRSTFRCADMCSLGRLWHSFSVILSSWEISRQRALDFFFFSRFHLILGNVSAKHQLKRVKFSTLRVHKMKLYHRYGLTRSDGIFFGLGAWHVVLSVKLAHCRNIMMDFDRVSVLPFKRCVYTFTFGHITKLTQLQLQLALPQRHPQPPAASTRVGCEVISRDLDVSNCGVMRFHVEVCEDRGQGECDLSFGEIDADARARAFGEVDEVPVEVQVV